VEPKTNVGCLAFQKKEGKKKGSQAIIYICLNADIQQPLGRLFYSLQYQDNDIEL